MEKPGTQPDTESTSTGCGCCHSDSAELGTPDAGVPGPEGADDSTEPTEANDTEQGEGGGCCGGTAGHSPADDNDTPDDGDNTSGEQPSSEGGCCQQPTPEQQLAEAVESQQRIAAEYANYRRRTERDRVAIGAVAKLSVLTELLPVIDDLDLAKQHGDLTGPLKAVNEKLRGVLTKYEVTEFAEEGQPFDPEIHEAVQDLSESDTKVIGTVLRRGYMMGDRLLRTAMVIIADPS